MDPWAGRWVGDQPVVIMWIKMTITNETEKHSENRNNYKYYIWSAGSAEFQIF